MVRKRIKAKAWEWLARFLTWLNDRLGVVETDDELNAYYDWWDRELDRREAVKRRLRDLEKGK